MTIAHRCCLVCSALILLAGCSTDTTRSQEDIDIANRITLHARPGDTFIVGAGEPYPFSLTVLNEGAGEVIVVCDKADFESPVTLGPRGEMTRYIADEGSATLNFTTEKVTSVTITAVTRHNRPIPVDFVPGPESQKSMSKAQVN